MLKSSTCILLALLGLAAHAQDFNDRRNVPRRQQDHRRGFNEGRNCTRIESELMHSLCRSGSRGSCQNATRSLGAGDGVLAEDLLGYHEMRMRNGQGMIRRGNINGSDKYSYTEYDLNLARDFMECEGRSMADFERDANREADEYHERMEREERERREREERERRRP
jgi:hypothetical protein